MTPRQSDVWTTTDLRNLLRTLALVAPPNEAGDGWRAALAAVAIALGIGSSPGGEPDGSEGFRC